MPCVFMNDANLVFACCAGEDVALYTAHMDLAKVTCSTPSEVCWAHVSFQISERVSSDSSDQTYGLH